MKAEDIKALIYIDSTEDVGLTQKEQFLLDTKKEYFNFHKIPFYIVHYDTDVDFLPEIKNHISINNKVFIKNKNINILDFFAYDLDATYIMTKNAEIVLHRANNNPSIPTVVLEDILLRHPKKHHNVSGTFGIISVFKNHLVSENSTNMSHTGSIEEIITAIPFMRRISKDTGTSIVLHLEKEKLQFMERMLLKFDFISGVNKIEDSVIHYDLKEIYESCEHKNKEVLTLPYFIQEGITPSKEILDLEFSPLKNDLSVFPIPEYNIIHLDYTYWRLYDWNKWLKEYDGLPLYFIGPKTLYDTIKHPKITKIKGGDLHNEFLHIANCKEYYGHYSYVSLIANDIGKTCNVEDSMLALKFLDFKENSYKNNYIHINDKGDTLYNIKRMKPNYKLDLKNVTLAIVDCIDSKRCEKVIDYCKEQADFGDIKLLTSLETDSPHAVKINPINSILEYSNFMLGELNVHIDTEFCLVIQHDGFIYDNRQWTKDFFKYDYIGAPAIGYDGPEVIQNGGFSLRSKKLLKLIQEEYKKTGNPGLAEDYYICAKNKDLVEASGLSFAPRNISEQFSTEPLVRAIVEDKPSFGFHYFFR